MFIIFLFFTHLDILSWAVLIKMSQKAPKIPDFIFHFGVFQNGFLSIFSAKHIYHLSSGFFSAVKKDILEEIKFGHLWFLKKCPNSKSHPVFHKKGLVSGMIDYFKYFSKFFYLHNVGVLVFCRRKRIDNTALQECRDNCLISYPTWSFQVKI